jgi:hypothetical protein
MSVGVALSTALFAYFQTGYAERGSEAEVFLLSYSMVIYVGMGLAAVSLILSLVRSEPGLSGRK